MAVELSARGYRHATNRVTTGLTSLTGFVSGAASIWIFCLMLLICADIFGRTIFNSPVQGVAEIVANSIVAIVFLQAAHALMSGRMTRTDLLIGPLEETGRSQRRSYVSSSIWRASLCSP